MASRWIEIMGEVGSIQDPFIAAQLYIFDFSSEQVVDNLANANGIPRGNGSNALAHAVTSAWVTAAYGIDTAQAVGNAKEWETADKLIANGQSWDTFRDLWNNEIGRQIGLHANNNGLSLDETTELVLDAYVSGRLIVQPGDTRIDPSFSGLPTGFNNNHAVWGGPSGLSNNFQLPGQYPIWMPNSLDAPVTPPYAAPCFAAGTPILLADGMSRAIEDIAAGDAIAAFDETDSQGRADLRAATVARLLPGVTEEWIVLEDGTRVTPGHRYLTEHGTWATAAELITSEFRAVAADGSLVPLRGTLLRATDAGSDAEWVTPEPYADGGNLVQPAPVFGRRTYNFEVAELHTCVAANENGFCERKVKVA